ncbi:MAG: Holliday junction resolvase RuvX [Bacteroidetes bacterium]|jgi:putative Holliday junction resolvase|nr:Holliday junction resolvase RuvX [Bacteroidota bacterium]
MGRIIAIDYGRKRTGIAVTDPDRIIASPLSTVPTHELIGFLTKYIEEEGVDCLVIGEPKQMDYTASEAEKYIAPFIKQVSKSFPDLKIERVDERFTSRMALQVILESGISKKGRRDKSLIDKISAAIILQTYLEMNNG